MCNAYVNAIEKRLEPDAVDMLKRIWEPTVVGAPLADSRRDLCVLPDGEIRCYGELYKDIFKDKRGVQAYLSSVDGGISWTKHYAKGIMGPCIYFPEGNIYVGIATKSDIEALKEKNLVIFRSEIGPDDENPESVVACEEAYSCSFQPVKSAFSNRIWFTAQSNDDYSIAYIYSDDWGKTWKTVKMPVPAEFEVVFPHKGTRWQINSGTEPIVAELSENKMLMLIRTPTDTFYKSYSYDGGENWTEPVPSEFYGTNTTPFLLRLRDGRVITFWNNTKPLPQPDFETNIQGLGNFTKSGRGEHGFNNRDAAHAAITEDGGETFIGYREIALNEIRNNADFRYHSTDRSTRDKSVHQFQAIELPFNKILVSIGQNTASAKLVIFDIDWLKETGNSENFLFGASKLTYHTYLKSLSSSQIDRIGNGHCSRNRTYAAVMMPDPLGDRFDVLSISKHHDDRLINDIGGAVWNFPISKQGKVTVELYIAEKQARFCLCDRWYNTCDPYVSYMAPFWFEIDAESVGNNYFKLEIEYDTEKGFANVTADGRHLFKVKMGNECPTGICYLVMQCATDGDSKGFYVKKLEKE